MSGVDSDDSYLRSTIIANNQAPTGADVATVTSSNYLRFDAEDSLVMAAEPRIHFSSSSVLTVAPQLRPLACNGGPTATHALSAGNPAINMGVNPGSDSWDQRGMPFVRSFGADVDMGAFELQTPPDVILADGFDAFLRGQTCH